MNENQRQAYLQAMGIQVYFPRLVLPGARPSPDYFFSEEPLKQKQQDEIVGGSGQHAESVAIPITEAAVPKPDGEAEAETGAEADSGTDIVLSQSAPGEDTLAEEELRFSLQYFKINDQIAVINEIPHVKSHHHSGESITLLKAILAALGIDSGQCQFEPGRFDWPITTGLPRGDDEQLVARNALFGFIRKRQEIDKFDNLILFCARIESLIQSSESGVAAHDFESTKHGFHITVTRSLHAMLSIPLLKCSVWQDLQVLKARVEASRS